MYVFQWYFLSSSHPLLPQLCLYSYPENKFIKTHVPQCSLQCFTVARTGKQPRCPLADEWMKKLWNIHIMEYYCTVCCMLSCSVTSDTLWPHGLEPGRLLCPWDSPGKSTRVGCHFLLQGIFPTQESNLWVLHLLHWQADSFPTEPPGKPLQWNITHP